MLSVSSIVWVCAPDQSWSDATCLEQGMHVDDDVLNEKREWWSRLGV